MPAMAAAREALTLEGLFGRAETPEILIKFLKEDLKLKNIADLIGYTAKELRRRMERARGGCLPSA